MGCALRTVSISVDVWVCVLHSAWRTAQRQVPLDPFKSPCKNKSPNRAKSRRLLPTGDKVPVSHSILTQSTSSPIVNGRRAMPVYCSAQTLGCSVDLRGNMQGCQQPEVRHARSTDDASIMHGSLAVHPRFTCKTYVGTKSVCWRVGQDRLNRPDASLVKYAHSQVKDMVATTLATPGGGVGPTLTSKTLSLILQPRRTASLMFK